GRGLSFSNLKSLESLVRLGNRAFHRLGVLHSTRNPLHLRTDELAAVAHEPLRRAQLLVTEYAREELCSLGGPHGRHHIEFLLPREVGVEELGARHSQSALYQLRNRTDRASDRLVCPIEVEFGAGQAARDPVTVAAQLEVKLDANCRPGISAVVLDGIACASCRGLAIERPRHGLENSC